MRFGFLSTLDNQLLPYFLRSALQKGLNNICVIIDPKISSDKDKEIFFIRTNDRLGSYCRVNKQLFELKKIIPFYFVDNHNSDIAINLYEELKLDCLLNAGTPRKLSNKLLTTIKGGVVNIHPGILPYYRGCSCVEWAIINNEPVGNSAHFMDLNYDTGPIICSESYSFDKNSNYVDIRVNVYLKGCYLAAKVLKDIEKKKTSIYNSIPQDQKEGKFWDPIPKDIEIEAINKANSQNYKYQVL